MTVVWSPRWELSAFHPLWLATYRREVEIVALSINLAKLHDTSLRAQRSTFSTKVRRLSNREHLARPGLPTARKFGQDQRWGKPTSSSFSREAHGEACIAAVFFDRSPTLFLDLFVSLGPAPGNS